MINDKTNNSFVTVTNIGTDKVARVGTLADLQVGTERSPAELHVTGRTSLSTKTYSVRGGESVTIETGVTHASIECKGGSGSVTVTLPSAPRVGQLCYVKDASGTASSNSLQVKYSTAGVDRSSQLTVSSPYASLGFIWSGSTWLSVASSFPVKNYGLNRLITSDGTESGVKAEANLKFDGSSLYIGEKTNIGQNDARIGRALSVGDNSSSGAGDIILYPPDSQAADIYVSSTTSSPTVNLFDTSPTTTLNIGGAATTVEIGASTGTTNVNNDLKVDGDLAVNGGNITSTSSTASLYNNGTNTTINIGSATTAASKFLNLLDNGSGDVTLDIADDITGGSLSVYVGSSSTSPEDMTFSVFGGSKAANKTVGIANNATGSTTTVNIAQMSTNTSYALTSTGSVGIGRSTGKMDVNIGHGASTGTAAQRIFKGIEIGTSGSSYSTTNIEIGSSVKNSTSVLNLSLGDLTTGATNIKIGSATATSGVVEINQALELNTNTILNSTGNTAITLATGASPAVTLSGDLKVTGNNIQSSTGTPITLSGTSMSVAGDLAVNGGDITTTATGTTTLFNTNATRVDIGSAATTVNIGASTGTTTVNNGLRVNGNATVDQTINANGGTIATTAATADIVNTTATTVNFAGAASTVNIGAASSTTTVGGDIKVGGNDIRNNSGDVAITMATGASPKVTLAGDLSITGGDITSAAATVSVFATNTTVNLGDSSPNASVGDSYSSGGTYSIGSGTTASGTKTVNIGNNGSGGATNINIGTGRTAGTTTITLGSDDNDVSNTTKILTGLWLNVSGTNSPTTGNITFPVKPSDAIVIFNNSTGASGATHTVTLPDISTAQTGRVLIFHNYFTGGADKKVTRTGSALIQNGATNTYTTATLGEGAVIGLYCRGANQWICMFQNGSVTWT